MTKFKLFLGTFSLMAISSCGTSTYLSHQAQFHAAKDTWDMAKVVEASDDDIKSGVASDGSYIVAFKVPEQGLPLAFPSFAGEVRTFYPLLSNSFEIDPRVKDIHFITSADLRPTSLPNANGAQGSSGRSQNMFKPPALYYSLDEANPAALTASIAKVTFSDRNSAKEALREWDEAGQIWFAEPNYISKLSTAYFDGLKTSYDALDSTRYWWLSKINLANSYQNIAKLDTSQRPADDAILGNPPVVAVMDSGVDYQHEAIASQIWKNPNIGEAACDNDEHGCNTNANSKGKLGNGDVFPVGTDGPGQACPDLGPCSHGTHVAGIIAGQVDKGVPGICPFCQIMIVKAVKDTQGNIEDSAILAGFKYVMLFQSHGQNVVRVVNSSFGKLTRSRAVAIVVRILRETGSGALVIAAAGNEETMRRSYPAALSDAIAVAATGPDGKKAQYSNFGPWVDISAPGGVDKNMRGIISSMPGGGTYSDAGTSMAAPMVSGLAGLLIGVYPNISFQDLKDRIINTANPDFYSATFDDGNYAKSYCPVVEGESIGIPLLGSGVMDSSAAIRNQAQGYALNESLDRVGAGCSVIGAPHFVAYENPFVIGISLWILPLIIVFSSSFWTRGLRKF